MIDGVPLWVVEYVHKWKKLLYLFEWEIKVSLSPHPSGDADGYVRGAVALYPDTLYAEIELRDEIPPAITKDNADEIKKWKITIIHELFHVRIGRVTEFVNQDLLMEFPTMIQGVVRSAFRREFEPVTEIMAKILYELETNDDT